MTTNLVYVEHPHLHECWSQVAPLLLRACERSEDWPRLGQVYERLDAGKWDLWVAVDVIGRPRIAHVTALADDVIEHILCGGDGLEDIQKHEARINEVAAQAGAKRARIIGRFGWARVLGYDLVNVDSGDAVLEKTL